MKTARAISTAEGVAQNNFSWEFSGYILARVCFARAAHNFIRLQSAQASGGNLELSYRKRTKIQD